MAILDQDIRLGPRRVHGGRRAVGIGVKTSLHVDPGVDGCYQGPRRPCDRLMVYAQVGCPRFEVSRWSAVEDGATDTATSAL
jgi:hypothetical protein